MEDIQYPVFKPIDGPWIALLVMGILTFISSLGGIALLFVFWRRLQQQRTKLTNANYILNNQPNANIPMPVQINERQPQSYETQKMEVFVPHDDHDINQRNLGEIHAHFTPQDGIKEIHKTYQRTTRAYF